MRRQGNNSQSGFTLLELMIVMAVFLVVMAAVLLQSRSVTQRAANERNQMDMFQEAREFMDQMSRDMREIGYPNPRNFDGNVLLATAQTTGDPTTSPNAAVGMIYAGTGDLWFQGGLDESNHVFVTQYHLDTSTSGNCPCLRRSQRTRSDSPSIETNGVPYPLTTPTWWTEVQNVQNATDPNNPVFRFYTNGGTTEVNAAYVTSNSGYWPLYWDPSPATANNTILASIDTVKVTLVVQSPYPDLQTGVKPIITLVSTVRVNNCSQAPNALVSCP